MIKKITRILIISVVCSCVYGGTFRHEPAGMIKGARLAWVSGSTVKVGVGYGEDAGDYWEIVPTDSCVTTGYALTGLASSSLGSVQYIYIDRSNSRLPSVILINSTTAPTWSDNYMGWYNGSNRCIAAVWVQPDGTIINFICPTDDIYIFPDVTLFTDNSISTVYNTWHTFDCTPYAPVNAFALRLAQSMWGGSWTYCLADIHPNSVAQAAYGPSAGTTTQGWIMFARGAPKSVQYQAWASSATGSEGLWYEAYQIER